MHRSAMDRREAIKHTLIACGGAAVGLNVLSGCAPKSPRCPAGADAPLGWTPSVIGPVFNGFADYETAAGLPTRLRVFYPSLDGAPENAPFVCGPGLFPLVLFLHGQCEEAPQYTKWSLLPTILARSGYVVAVPDLGGGTDYAWELGNSTYQWINGVLSWMRSSWPHTAFLMPEVLGIVGHSYGAMHGGQLAATTPVTAYVSLSGGWSEWSPAPLRPARPLENITVPKLLVWGTAETEAPLSQARWDSLSSPKYRLRLTAGEHWDYISPSGCDTSSGRGPCGAVGRLTADLTCLFLSKFMPPDGVGVQIGDDLVPPNISPGDPNVINGRGSFLGGHLASFAMMAQQPSCHADLTWVTASQSSMKFIP